MANGECRTEVARPKGTVVTLFEMQNFISCVHLAWKWIHQLWTFVWGFRNIALNCSFRNAQEKWSLYGLYGNLIRIGIFKSRWFLSSIFRFVDQKCYKIENYNTLGINPAITETAFNFTNEEPLTVLCSVVKHTRKRLEHKISVEINKCVIVKCFSILLERCSL